jgi:hypothetical protein
MTASGGGFLTDAHTGPTRPACLPPKIGGQTEKREGKIAAPRSPKFVAKRLTREGASTISAPSVEPAVS